MYEAAENSFVSFVISRNTQMTLQLLGISDQQEYKELVYHFVAWCKNNHLILNTIKIKKTIGDFKRSRNKPNTIFTLVKDLEAVEYYRHLVVYLDNRLDLKCNTEVVYKKGHNRLYFLRKLRSFHVCTKMLYVFYRSVLESATCFAASVGAAVSEPETQTLQQLSLKKQEHIATIRGNLLVSSKIICQCSKKIPLVKFS